MNSNKLAHRSGAVIIQNKKVLVERSKGKNFFIPPGGRLERGETPKQSLIRELKEELQIEVSESDLIEFESYFKKAGGQEDYDVKMDLFIVKNWNGEIKSDSEVEEILWIDSNIPKNISIGSIFEKEVMPKLKEQELIG
jgi:mutator protein MutT